MYEYLLGGALPPPRDVKYEGERIVRWRIVDSPGDATETFIPMNPTVRSWAVLQRLLDGPTDEEREATAQDQAACEAERIKDMDHRRARHAALVTLHADHPVLSALLDQHAPHPVDHGTESHLECHGCPTFYSDDDEGGDWYHHAWPCPTWTTIAEQTEAQP